MLDAPDQTVASPEQLDPEAAAAVAKALAHPARIRIIALLLSRPGCIGYEIVDEIGLAQSTVSEHLRILKAAGLVTGEIERPRVCYSLNPSALAPLTRLIETIAARGAAAPSDRSMCCVAPHEEESI